jgi:hypothetical protein
MGAEGENRRAWTTDDAWVLAAIINDTPPRPRTLAEVMAIADGINHSMFTEAEFTRAIGRLVAAGLIEADGAADRYQPTESGAAIRKRWRHGAFGWIPAIPPQLDRIGEPQDLTWSLPAGAFDRAIQDYRARMAKLTRRYRAR